MNLLHLFLLGILLILSGAVVIHYCTREQLRRYRVFWRSPVGGPPCALDWKPSGRDLYVKDVLARDAAEAMGLIHAAYLAAPGYPPEYRPEFVSVKEIINPVDG